MRIQTYSAKNAGIASVPTAVCRPRKTMTTSRRNQWKSRIRTTRMSTMSSMVCELPLWWRTHIRPWDQKMAPMAIGTRHRKSKRRMGANGCPRGPPARMRTTYSTTKMAEQAISTSSRATSSSAMSWTWGIVATKVLSTFTKRTVWKKVMTYQPLAVLSSVMLRRFLCNLQKQWLTPPSSDRSSNAGSPPAAQPARGRRESGRSLAAACTICSAVPSRTTPRRCRDKAVAFRAFMCRKYRCIFTVAVTAAAMRRSAISRSCSSRARMR
mmetsp:Transcript_130412/g.405697  ORF Transcript_130412/g.405697 Transcript_130412/m.405697 type:complete len:268 (-) Transcript_130412:286-1089(-)